MKTYTIKFDHDKLTAFGIGTPELQSGRTALWLLGMSESVSVVTPDIQLTIIVTDRWWIQFRCNSEELVNLIRERLSCYGATVEPLSPA